MTRPACPNQSKHTPGPAGYIERAEWKERMSKTHREIQCDACGLWAIWVPKVKP